jgi:cysteine protease ATG4
MQHSATNPPLRSCVTDTLTQWFRHSRQACSSRTSTSLIVTAAAPLGKNNALSSSQTSCKIPARIGRQNSLRILTSRIWITHHSHSHPIPDSSLPALEHEQAEAAAAESQRRYPLVLREIIGGRTANRDVRATRGWGRMLRTSQSLLATVPIHLHLRRGTLRDSSPQFLSPDLAVEWQRPPQSGYNADYATYIQILTWFFDSPPTLCPFSVHLMALAGKELGKDVGQWFGPRTAAGAIKCVDISIALV